MDSRLLDPLVLSRIADLELVAKSVVEGFVTGLHRSAHMGLSTDFAEHRAYVPGDDVRRVDWKLYARTDRYYVKEFEAETNAGVSVLLDVSRSMHFASEGQISKLAYARMLAASLLYFSQRQRDRVGVATFDADIVEHVPPSTRHLPLTLHALARAEARRPGGLRSAARRMAESFRRRSILVLISDLYEEPDDVLSALHELRGSGSDVVVFHLLDPAELDFPFPDAISLQDMEGDDAMPVIPDKLRERYRALVAEHIAALRGRIGGSGMDYFLFDTRRPLGDALFEYLLTRERMAHGRFA